MGMYKNAPITGTFTWNLNKLVEGTIEFNIVGKKAPFLGDFTFTRKINWSSKPSTIEVVWEGKVETNMTPALATPLLSRLLFAHSLRSKEFGEGSYFVSLALLIN